MSKYRCKRCTYNYDDELGEIESGIVPGTDFASLKYREYTCPMCGGLWDEFELVEEVEKNALSD